MSPLPRVHPLADIARWLPEIFPEGTPNRPYLVREIAAKTLFAMLYAGAVEGTGRWLRPNQVTRMTDAQAGETDEVARQQWSHDSLRAQGGRDLTGRWYAVDTREPIRDETLRSGFVAVGAVVERPGLPTTSAKPRYAVAAHFAELLDELAREPADTAATIARWQERHLSAAALGRVRLLRQAAVRSATQERVTVTFPSGETRLMHPGPSTVISKAVIESFAVRFLREPGVVFLSESGNKVVARDEALAAAIGLQLDYSRALPDIILADAAAEHPRVFFVEVVASDGAVTAPRRDTLLRVAADAGYDEGQILFVTAFLDRGSPAFRRLVSELAWGTYAWFVAEPERVVALGDVRLYPVTPQP